MFSIIAIVLVIMGGLLLLLGTYHTLLGDFHDPKVVKLATIGIVGTVVCFVIGFPLLLLVGFHIIK